MKSGFLLGMVLLVGYSCGTSAHGQSLRARDLPPRIGVMSEEVVRHKLHSYGVEITQFERQEDRYIAHVQTEGKSEVLEINRLTGALQQDGQSLRMQPSANAMPLTIKPDPQRVPWVQRTIRFEKMGVEGIRLPAQPMNR